MAATQSPPPLRSEPAIEQVARSLDDLHIRILRKLTQSPTLNDAIADAAAELVDSASGFGVFHASRAEDGQLASPRWIIAPADAYVISSPAIAALAWETINKSKAVAATLPSPPRAQIMAVGVYFRGRAPEVLGLVAPPEADAQALLAALQLAATSVSLWGVMPRSSAAPVSLADRCIAACQDAESLTAAYQRVVLVLGDAFGQSVCIGERGHSGGAKIIATSSSARFSSSTSLSRAATEAIAATLASGEEQLWVFRDAINNEAGPIMSFALAAEAQFVFAAPLAEMGQPARIAILIFGNPPASGIEPIVAQSRAAWPKLAGFLNLLQRVRAENRLLKWLAPLRRPLQGANRYITLPIAAAIAVLLFLPVTDTAPADCTIEPSSRRYVVAPQEGLLAKSLVEPGETVKAGQELAILDRHALELEIAGQEAALQQSQLRRDAALARGEAGQAGIFTLEATQAEENLALLELRRDQLTVRSPIEGVILRGDLQRTLGAPLTKGQVLFEVAPLNELVAEIAIPEEEIHHIAPGMAVSARLDAFSGRVFLGVLDRVHPRAEMREDVSVFIAEMTLDTQGAPIRPGMRGRASIEIEKSPLAWTWMRRPVTGFLRKLGW